MKSQNMQGKGSISRASATSVSEREMLINEETVELTYENSENGLAQSPQEPPENHRAPRLAATGGLAVILGQLVAYFHHRTNIDDLDVLSFSLHHLFCRIDFLYETALPRLAALAEAGTGTASQDGSHHPPYAQQQAINHTHPVRHREQLWTQLQTINRTLDRMEPICHLLSDATECILERFDASTDMLGFLDQQQGEDESNKASEQNDDINYFQMIDAGRWDHAFAAITNSLLSWQTQYGKLTPFTTQFAPLLQAIPLLPEIDTALATILDSAGAIFGDILPGFRAILESDEAMIAALLYDLMQQSDHLLVKFDTTLEPMNMLIKYYAVGTSLS
jgi:hypothetical protein